MTISDNREDHFFGDLLKMFRKNKNLTQLQLAKQIGASREAVSLWERGMFKPETTTMVEVLVKSLGLDNEEKRLLFEAYTGAASILPMYNLPPYNPYFTGREEILSDLHRHLTRGSSVALIQPQAISGLGGIGKTQVAIEYAYRFREYYHNILWITADSRQTLINSYLTLAGHLRLGEQETLEQHKVIDAVKRWLREHKGWLLILDNIEDLKLVQEFVPIPQQGAVILTTRRGETRPIAEALILETLPEEEGILFLLRRAGYLSKEATLETVTSSNIAIAQSLVQIMGGLPLAIDQAGAYIAETKCSLSDYFGLFEQRQMALLDRRGTLPHDHLLSVKATFSLAFEQVQQKNKAAIDLLKFWAFLAPDAIPLEIITKGAAYLGKVLEAIAVDVVLLDQALEILQAYSLIRRNGENHTISIHRLVQAVLVDTLPARTRKQWQMRVIQAVAAKFPQKVRDELATCERIWPHALVCVHWIESMQKPTREAAHFLDRVGSYLRERAMYLEAELLYKKSILIWEQQLEPSHSDIARSLNNLAILYINQGKYSEAEPLFQQVLVIREQQLGSLHPDTAQSLNNLANLYGDQGKYAEAELLYQRALIIREQQLGSQHPDTAQSLENLAILYKDQQKYAKAEPLLQQALIIRKHQLGLQHPDTAQSFHNLAELYRLQEQYGEAEPLYQQALAIWTQQLEPNHPIVSYPIHGLAALFREQGKHEQATSLFLRALAIRENTFASTHLDLAETLHEFAILRETQGYYEEAQSLYERALVARKHMLGVDHPHTADTNKRLVALLHDIGRTESAAE